MGRTNPMDIIDDLGRFKGSSKTMAGGTHIDDPGRRKERHPNAKIETEIIGLSAGDGRVYELRHLVKPHCRDFLKGNVLSSYADSTQECPPTPLPELTRPEDVSGQGKAHLCLQQARSALKRDRKYRGWSTKKEASVPGGGTRRSVHFPPLHLFLSSSRDALSQLNESKEVKHHFRPVSSPGEFVKYFETRHVFIFPPSCLSVRPSVRINGHPLLRCAQTTGVRQVPLANPVPTSLQLGGAPGWF